MESKNIKEAKELVVRYREITLEDILEEQLIEDNLEIIANKLTGFGLSKTCSLCRAVSGNCDKCIYNGYCGCMINYTYNKISNAKTPKQLLKAFELRADYIEEVIKELEENQ